MQWILGKRTLQLWSEMSIWTLLKKSIGQSIIEYCKRICRWKVMPIVKTPTDTKILRKKSIYIYLFFYNILRYSHIRFKLFNYRIL